MEEILLFLRRLKNDIDNKIDGLGTSFDGWKLPWTAARAAKIDRLNVDVSSRASAADYTPARAAKLDRLDVAVSTRADGAVYTPARAVKLDNLDATMTSRAADSDVQTLLARGTVKRVQRGKMASGTADWTANGDMKYYYKDVTLPYSVDVNKSTEMAFLINGATSSSGTKQGIMCSLISSTILRVEVPFGPISTTTPRLVDSALTWIVTEGY